MIRTAYDASGVLGTTIPERIGVFHSSSHKSGAENSKRTVAAPHRCAGRQGAREAMPLADVIAQLDRLDHCWMDAAGVARGQRIASARREQPAPAGWPGARELP